VSARPLTDSKGGRDILRPLDLERDDLKAELAGRRLQFAQLQHDGRIADITHDRQPAETGDGLTQQGEPLAGEIDRLDRQAGDVPARPRQTGNQVRADRVARRRKHDRDHRRRLPGRDHGRGSPGDNDVDLEPDKFGRDLGEALVAPVRPAIFDRERATLHPAELAQPLREGGRPLALAQRRALAQEADGRRLAGLLRPRRKRPSNARRGRAADKRDERPAIRSITSSACASSVAGTSRPSARAVCRLRMNSNLAARITGRLAGASPLRMRPA
jgi:hypothetical protein